MAVMSDVVFCCNQICMGRVLVNQQQAVSASADGDLRVTGTKYPRRGEGNLDFSALSQN